MVSAADFSCQPDLDIVTSCHVLDTVSDFFYSTLYIKRTSWSSECVNWRLTVHHFQL